MYEQKPIVFLVDDDPAVLKTLPRALEQHGLLVRPYGSAHDFLQSYSDEPGCLVLDLSLPEMNGLELQAELKARNINIPIIFITGHGGVPESVNAMRAGAVDFLEKPFLPELLRERIAEAVEKDRNQRTELAHKDGIRSRFLTLTERENEVLRLLIEGDDIPSSKAIASTLDISHRTVEHHRGRILEKAQCGSVPELRILAKDAGVNFPDTNPPDAS